MAWQYDGYLFKDGWFLSQEPTSQWDDDVLKFSADGVTTKAEGLPGVTRATNWLEERKDENGGWPFNVIYRPSGEGDDITFELNKDDALIKGIQDHAIHYKSALTQTLDDEIEAISWIGSDFSDAYTLNANTYRSNLTNVGISSEGGDDFFYINGYVSLFQKCGNPSGAWLDGGSGFDTLILEGKFSEYDVRISDDPESPGFQVEKRNVGGCNWITAIDIESIQGQDFEWIYGQDQPVMGTPPARSPELGDEEEVVNSPAITNNYITNIFNNVTNVTSNVTTVNASNSGKGDINIGDIGAVSNAAAIDNSFVIQSTNINLSIAVTGTSKKGEKVEGTDGDDLMADGRGRDKLVGGDGADQFYFSGEEPFKKKTVDKIIDFDGSEGDAIVIADEVFGGLAQAPALAFADTRKNLKQLAKDGYELLYLEPKGDLYVDGNGDAKGFGKKSEGGVIADLPNGTILMEDDVLIGV